MKLLAELSMTTLVMTNRSVRGESHCPFVSLPVGAGPRSVTARSVDHQHFGLPILQVSEQGLDAATLTAARSSDRRLNSIDRANTGNLFWGQPKAGDRESRKHGVMPCI